MTKEDKIWGKKFKSIYRNDKIAHGENWIEEEKGQYMATTAKIAGTSALWGTTSVLALKELAENFVQPCEIATITVVSGEIAGIMGYYYIKRYLIDKQIKKQETLNSDEKTL